MPARIFWPLALALITVALTVACGRSEDDSSSTNRVNGSVRVEAGKPAESANTVNGSVRIDDNAAAKSANTVNGSIHLGAHATADSLSTVNGSVTLDEGAHAAGPVTAVNGGLTLKEGSDVVGLLSNVNGKIELKSASAEAGIKTSSGSISILGTSRVTGGIVVEKPTNELIHFGNDVPRIIIGPGATVLGEMKFERKVELYVSDQATIGPVTGASPVVFSGDSPPQ